MNPNPGVKTITQVERQKKNRHRYNIYLDGEYALAVHEDLLIKYRLLKGECVEPDQLEAILAEDERHRAYLDALNFIGYRARSVKEVCQKLKQKGYEPELCQAVIDKLREQGYLDDREFAKQWAQERLSLQKKGRKLVEMELLQKGVDKSAISDAVGQIGEDEELNHAIELAAKKWKLLDGEPAARRRKLYAFLARRGYPGSVVSQAVRRVAGSSEEEWSDWE